jgi:hypothetical protein
LEGGILIGKRAWYSGVAVKHKTHGRRQNTKLTLACLIPIMVGLLGTPAAGDRKHKTKRTDFGTGVETGFKLVQYHDTCVLFRSFFISDDFFVGLNHHNTPAGPEYRRGNAVFRTFPDRIIVDVEADAVRCSGLPNIPLPPDFGSGLLSALSFQLSWKKDNSQSQPIVVVSTKMDHPNHGIRWDYFLDIPAKDIPLTTVLEIRLSARDRIILGAFSAHLE